MTDFPVSGTFDVPAVLTDFDVEDFATAQELFLAATKQIPGGAALTELTVSSGVITPTLGAHTVDTEADGATDDLSNIQVTNTRDGACLILWPENSGRVVTLKHAAGGSGQISLLAATDLELTIPVVLQLQGSVWYEVFHGEGVGGHTALEARLTAVEAWVIRGFGGSSAVSFTGCLAFGAAGYATLAVTQTDPVSMKVAVAGGIYAISGTPYVLSAAGESAVMTAPLTNPRIDKICLDSDGAVQVTTGVEAVSPAVPATPAGQFPLATVYHRVGEASIKTADDSSNGYVYSDLRVWFN